jgi:hypothetical protein
MIRVLWFCVMLSALGPARGQEAGRYALVIHEIFADPSPSRGLPNAEFIELRNRSGADIDLKNFQFSNGTSTGRINASFTLRPDSMVILSSSGSAALFQSFGKTVVLSPFPSLNNEGDTLVLLSPNGAVVHAVAWDKRWYRSDVKQEGGWSLEMMDIKQPCAGLENWTAALAPSGGTPGKRNSAERSLLDTMAPWISYAYMEDSITLRVCFSEPLAKIPALALDNYSVSGAKLVAPLFNQVQALLSRPLLRGALGKATLSGVADCMNNTRADSVRFGIPTREPEGKLVINEILFDPPVGGSDYLELFNRSEEVVDISSLLIANRNSSGRISSMTAVVPAGYPLLPGGYLAICSDTAWLKQYYQPGKVDLLQLDLPSYPDDAGSVVVTDGAGRVVDELAYSSKWHQALVSEPRGIALERLLAEGSTQDPANWYSAASSVRFGTPGLPNSQSPRNPANGRKVMSLSSPLISPDLDGRDDILLIRYVLPAPGWVANITVFDTGGMKRKTIANNALCGREGFFRWDGRAEDNTILRSGNYIIYGEFFSLNGERLRERLPVGIWN